MGRESRVSRLRTKETENGTVSMVGTALEFAKFMNAPEPEVDIEAEAAEIISQCFGG